MLKQWEADQLRSFQNSFLSKCLQVLPCANLYALADALQSRFHGALAPSAYLASVAALVVVISRAQRLLQSAAREATQLAAEPPLASDASVDSSSKVSELDVVPLLYLHDPDLSRALPCPALEVARSGSNWVVLKWRLPWRPEHGGDDVDRFVVHLFGRTACVLECVCEWMRE
jgi:hypothetical protein